MISTLVLDLDGPLLDGKQRHYRCYSDILEESGFKPIPVQQYWDMKRNRVNRRDLLAFSGAVSFYDEFLESWINRIETRKYLQLDRLQNHVIDVLSQWKLEKRRLVLATMRNSPLNLTWQLEQLELEHYFDDVVVVNSGRGGENKASEVRPKLRCNLENVIWIGDTEIDIAAARKLRIKVCALTCGLRTREFLSTLSPDEIEEDLHSFAKKMKGND
jgi:phosphoglycolate phosphatase-like HAD superfamily hydrolase